MNRKLAEKLGRSILYRERLVKKLPALLAEVVDRMDTEGHKVIVGETVRIVRDNGGIRVVPIPPIDPRQMRLWKDDDD